MQRGQGVTGEPGPPDTQLSAQTPAPEGRTQERRGPAPVIGHLGARDAHTGAGGCGAPRARLHLGRPPPRRATMRAGAPSHRPRGSLREPRGTPRVRAGRSDRPIGVPEPEDQAGAAPNPPGYGPSAQPRRRPRRRRGAARRVRGPGCPPTRVWAARPRPGPPQPDPGRHPHPAPLAPRPSAALTAFFMVAAILGLADGATRGEPRECASAPRRLPLPRGPALPPRTTLSPHCFLLGRCSTIRTVGAREGNVAWKDLVRAN